ncbi:MAG TPA: SpoIIE family protein phosphatase [Thermoanaerobaculia bacterium]
MRRGVLFAGLMLASALSAQEPRAAHVSTASFQTGDGAAFTLAWRYAPGDAPGRESPQFDDSNWALVAPALGPGEFPQSGWNGVGWFRRHLIFDRAVQDHPIALTFSAPGTADVYLDGALVLSVGRSASPLIPAQRSDAAAVTFRGDAHVIAVRYTYPPDVSRPEGGFGFRLTLAPAVPQGLRAAHDWIVAMHGAIVALPVFLVFLHLALFAFDRRARENLYYAGEMLSFALIVLHEYRENFFASDAARDFIDRTSAGTPMVAIFFGILTYYSVRTKRIPRSWRLMAAIGLVLFVASFVARDWSGYLWMPYFAAMLIDIVRIEHRGDTIERGGTAIFLLSFAAFSIAVVLQILITFGVLKSVGGITEVYVFGIVASAVGMSLYLARNVGDSRIFALENERKTRELNRARELQLSMLPRDVPRVEGLDVAVGIQTAAEVGGDYYDIRRDGDDALLVAFGDATGHGLASGIVVTAAKALFSSVSPDGSLAGHLGDFSRALRAMHLPGFLRMCLSLTRVSRNEAVVASAAMPPILIRRAATRCIEELGRGELPLGSSLTLHYQERRTALSAGDTLLFATDGFAEQALADGRQFGYDGVAGALLAAGDAPSASEVIGRLFAIAAEFRGARPQDDDITFVVVRVS